MGRYRGFKVPRYWSNEVLRAIAPRFEGDVINVSAWMDEDKQGGRYRDYFTGASSYSTSNFTGRKGTAESGAVTDYLVDLTGSLPPELVGRFDVVFNHTTLEHIYDVRAAFANLCSMSRDVVILVVPFAQETHGPEYGDFWRFTPMCMRRLFEDHGLHTVYESATPHENAGIYLIVVGARQPERWRDRMPAWEPLGKVGEWIGRDGPLRRLKRRLAR